MTLYDLKDVYLEYALSKYSPPVYSMYRTKLTRYILPVIGDIEINKISKADINEIYAYRKQTNPSLNTLRGLYSAIHSVFKFLYTHNYTSTNLAKGTEVHFRRKAIEER